MKRVLFQGDSITDAGRDRENGYNLGNGYPNLVAAELGFEKPGQYEFINRGIGGNRSIDLLARIKIDGINLKPDIMSILVGVNDVWHDLGLKNGVDSETYELYYDLMVSQILKSLPKIKLIILEPFLLKGLRTEEEWDTFRSETEKRAAASRRIAEKYDLPFVPLMQKFDEAEKRAPSDVWLLDGVHPTAAGHELIAREWIAAFKKIEPLT